ncbi:MAG: homoserine dehydrogenase [Candidatus Taylorbacteria bacterium]|nr:homoserine dehydrogenase [Candidatus Taylorbacteria bacterium]
MKKDAKIIIIGGGQIATHLKDRLENQGRLVALTIANSKNETPFAEEIATYRPDIVFLAISTKDKGEAAKKYIEDCIEARIPIVTCEKGSLAYHADELRPFMHRIGFSATVGGGTGMLRYLKGFRFDNKKVEINAMPNGTFNFIFDEFRSGRQRTPEQACQVARSRGYVEPGAVDALSIMNNELDDVRMKTCVLFNRVLAARRVITPDDLGPLKLDREDLRGLFIDEVDYRMVVTFSNYELGMRQEYCRKKLVLRDIDGWHISVSFLQILYPTRLSSMLPKGADNVVSVTVGEEPNSQETYTLTGPGAGCRPTVSAMLADADELCRG